EAGNLLGGVGVLVELDALHERGRAVADADDGDADLVVLVAGHAVGGYAPVGRSLAVGLAHEIDASSEDCAGETHPSPRPWLQRRRTRRRRFELASNVQ